MINGRLTHVPDHVPSERRSNVQSAMVPASRHDQSRTYRVRELVRTAR
jgi:hypothetical protein